VGEVMDEHSISFLARTGVLLEIVDILPPSK
jgi:hypothetical protein